MASERHAQLLAYGRILIDGTLFVLLGLVVWHSAKRLVHAVAA